MSKTLAKLIEEITEWQDKIFTQATPFTAAEHLRREVKELTTDLIHENTKSVRYEVADCFLLLIAVAHLSGIDLEAAIEEKMVINQGRTWGRPDAQGVVEHVRESEIEASISKEIVWDGENIRWRGKTLVEIFTEEGIISPDLNDAEDILIKISKEGIDGTLQTD